MSVAPIPRKPQSAEGKALWAYVHTMSLDVVDVEDEVFLNPG